MTQRLKSFRHESLQDAETIQEFLKAITKGLGKGKLSFSDEDGEIVMRPEGLLNLRVTAAEEESQNRISIRITWQTLEDEVGNGPLKIK